MAWQARAVARAALCCGGCAEPQAWPQPVPGLSTCSPPAVHFRVFPVIFVLPIMLFLDHSHYPRLAPKAEAPPRAPRRPFAAEAPRSALLAAFPCGFSLRRTATPGCAQIRKMKGIKMLLQFAIPRFLASAGARRPAAQPRPRCSRLAPPQLAASCAS